MDNHFPEPRKISQKKGKIQLVKMWSLRRWISSPGKNSTGYEYRQIWRRFQPLNSSVLRGNFYIFKGFLFYQKADDFCSFLIAVRDKNSTLNGLFSTKFLHLSG